MLPGKNVNHDQVQWKSQTALGKKEIQHFFSCLNLQINEHGSTLRRWLFSLAARGLAGVTVEFKTI